MDNELFDFDYEPTYEDLYGKPLEPEADLKYQTGTIAQSKKPIPEHEKNAFNVLNLDKFEESINNQNKDIDEIFYDIESDGDQIVNENMIEEEPSQP